MEWMAIMCLTILFLWIAPYGCAGEAPITGFKTERDFMAHMNRWLTRHVVDTFDKRTASSGEMKSAAHDFLDRCCRFETRHAGYPNLDELISEGNRLVGSGCTDPLVTGWLGIAFFHRHDYSRAIESLRLARDHIEKSRKYPNIQKFYFNLYLAESLIKSGSRGMTEIWDCEKNAIDRYVDTILEGEFREDESPVAYEVLMDHTKVSYRNSRWADVAGKLTAAKQVDPWLVLMIDGTKDFRAGWDARGHQFARDVAKERWEIFEKNLISARAKFREAWNLRPAYPEPATSMIGIAMAGHAEMENFQTEDGFEPQTLERLWLDRAMRVRTDPSRAFANYRHSLRPRWGGSHSELIRYGEECLNSGRFDTFLPIQYLKSLITVADESERNAWRQVFRNPGVEENLMRMFDSMLKEPVWTGQDRLCIQTLKALVTAWCGHYDRASTMVTSLDAEIMTDREFGPCYLSWQARPWVTIKAELRAFTGPFKDKLIQAEHHNHVTGNIDQALNLYLEAMKDYAADRDIHDYLRDRIAYVMMDSCLDVTYNQPIFTAIYKDRMDVADFLVGNEADVNKTMGNGYPALAYAISYNRMDLARKLIERGSDINRTPNSGFTPLMGALDKKNTDLAEILIMKGADIRARSRTGDHALVIACRNELWKIVELLIDAGVDVRETADESALLYTVIDKRNKDLAMKLIAMDVDPDIVANTGWTPAMVSVYRNMPGVTLALIKKGIDVNQKNPDGWPLTFLALINEEFDTFKALIEHGADINATQKEGMTCLYYAAMKGYEDVVQFMLDHDADKKLAFNTHLPIDVAKKEKHHEIAEMLK